MPTYKILGTDGKEYGPINADVLRQWIAQRRANAGTSAQAEGGTDWKPLSSFPEFADTLAGEPPASPLPPSGPLKTSRLAIASLVCGGLGFLCLPALAGVVLGIVALLKINRSKGQLRGQALAICGICLSAFMLLTAVPIGAALLLPALAKAKARSQQFNSQRNAPPMINSGLSRAKDEAERVYCVNNLKQICLAARMYSGDNQNTLPPDFLSMSNYLGSPKILVCRADRKHTTVSTWAEFDPSNNLTYEYLKPGLAESNALSEVIFRCPIHNNVGLGDGSVQQGLRKPR
jgi:hypothetical protein